MPIELRCSERVGFRQISDVIVDTEIATYPQGEGEFSIYRDPDGMGDDLTIKGLNLNSELAVGAFGIEDTRVRDFIDNEVLPGDKSAVYAERKTKLSSVSKAIYNDPIYAKCVKTQFERQFCPPNVLDVNKINLSHLKNFLNRFVDSNSRSRLSSSSDNGYKEIRLEILQTPANPFGVVSIHPRVTFINPEKVSSEEFNNQFYSEILSKKEILRSHTCFIFRITGEIEEGSLVELSLNGCDSKGAAITKANNVNISNKRSMFDFVDSEDQTFSFYKHRNQSEDSEKSNITFRNQALDSNVGFTGKSLESATEIKNARVSSDVRFSDYQLDVYNTGSQS